MIHQYIADLTGYALQTGLIEAADFTWAVNSLLQVLGLDAWEECVPAERPLEEILTGILDWAEAQGRIDGGVTGRDLLDTKLMGVLTPRPSQVLAVFRDKYRQSPKTATDWYYKFSQDTDYIRRYRIVKDVKWVAPTPYGDLDITINLSKPEKDPKAIAAAKLAPQSGYPKCLLCRENEGYAGRMNHPARQNHRIIPITINQEDWFFQYSPYVYYNEHCIVFNGQHVPMKIDRATFRKQLDFIRQFPHYFVGSNADLPIVGGSILSHDHFQGGRYTFAMEKAPVEQAVSFPGFDDVEAGIVKWPMSVIRLRCADDNCLVDLAEKILRSWRGYTDEAAFIFAETEGEPHHPHRPDAGRPVRAGPGAAEQPHHGGISLRCVPPPSGTPPHQKGEYRPYRGHGPGGAALPAEGRAGSPGGGPGGRPGHPGRRDAGKARRLGGGAAKPLYLYPGKRHGHPQERSGRCVCPGAGARRCVQVHGRGPGGVPAVHRKRKVRADRCMK